MRKVLSLSLVVVILFLLSACNNATTVTCTSCGENNPDNANFCSNCGVKFAGKNAENIRMAASKLQKFILENGAAYDQDLCAVIKEDEQWTRIIASSPENHFFFYLGDNSREDNIYFSMRFIAGNEEQNVRYYYETQDETVIADGTVYISSVSKEDFPVEDIEYTYDSDYFELDASTKEFANNMLLACGELMLFELDSMFREDIGISVCDLGFTNW